MTMKISENLHITCIYWPMAKHRKQNDSKDCQANKKGGRDTHLWP